MQMYILGAALHQQRISLVGRHNLFVVDVVADSFGADTVNGLSIHLLATVINGVAFAAVIPALSSAGAAASLWSLQQIAYRQSQSEFYYSHSVFCSQLSPTISYTDDAIRPPFTNPLIGRRFLAVSCRHLRLLESSLRLFSGLLAFQFTAIVVYGLKSGGVPSATDAGKTA